ncbi:hypothetical protein KKH30_01135 [Candidatus Micrarchaeota archaeon]|nr:hypothetical protein [Candidatus Micrarchaeota archaeon]MBU1939346.1 hypothetical protein [Candidatus Micrarchaeota archaeon]
MNRFVVDASSLISLSGSCLVKLLRNFSESADIAFHIPQSVYYESVERPIKIRRFELNAVRIKDAVDSGYLHVERKSPEITSLTHELEMSGNCMNYADGRPIKLIQLGETESLALARTLKARVVVIDERTTRMLVEDAYALQRFLENRYGRNISINKPALSRFHSLTQGVNFIRSSELVALAYENNLFEPELQHTKQALEAALYAVKFGGCAVSMREIDTYIKGVQQ